MTTTHMNRAVPHALSTLAGIGLAISGMTAHAQVTLYGLVDASLARLDQGGNSSPVNAVASGIGAGSRWGMRVDEDLGGGLRAAAVLEAGLEVDTGVAKVYSGNPNSVTPSAPNGIPATGFNRRSFVSLGSNSVGTLALGRDYAPVYYPAVATDNMRMGYFNNIQVLVAPAGGQERFARISNAIFYTAPSIAGLVVRAAYSFGSESSGAGGLPDKANHFFGMSAVYTYEALVLAGSYQVLRFPTVSGTPLAFTGRTDTREDWMLSGKYKIGNFSVAGGHFHSGHPQHFRNSWIGGNYLFGGVHTILTQLQWLTQTNAGNEAKGKAFAIAYQYDLSKRSALYTSYGRTFNNSSANFAVTSSDLSVPASARGADPSGFAVGIRHAF